MRQPLEYRSRQKPGVTHTRRAARPRRFWVGLVLIVYVCSYGGLRGARVLVHQDGWEWWRKPHIRKQDIANFTISKHLGDQAQHHFNTVMQVLYYPLIQAELFYWWHHH